MRTKRQSTEIGAAVYLQRLIGNGCFAPDCANDQLPKIPRSPSTPAGCRSMTG